ncbi:hypothetical protein Kpol_1057p18, partial [Vanderwaltozyma polyspora DSM 70294]
MDKTNTEWAKDIPCRNVIIYGYCKKEKEGCPFKHENGDSSCGDDEEPVKSGVSVVGNANLNSASSTPTAPSSSASNVTQGIVQPVGTVPKFNAKISASFTPMGVKPVDSGEVPQPQPQQQLLQLKSQTPQPPQLPPQLPSLNAMPNSQLASNASVNSITHSFDPYSSKSFTPTTSSGNMMSMPMVNSESMEPQFKYPIPPPMGNPGFAGTPPVSAPPAMNMKFPTIYPPPHSLLQYHLYAPDPPPHFNLSLKPNEELPESLFIPNKLRETLVKRNLAALQVLPAGGALPDIVQDYFGLVPLDFHKSEIPKDNYHGHKNSLYKVFSNVDGNIYILRRIHDAKITDPSLIAQTFKEWNKLSSVNLVHLKDLFVTSKFGDNSLCAVYDYYPLATSLYESHFVNFPRTPITQNYLWSYLTQLTNVIKTIHSNGLWIGPLLDWDK